MEVAATTCREDEFAAETDRLWGQVKPLYDQLHCYTRRKLNKMYGDKVVAEDRPDPVAPARQHVGADRGATCTPSSSRTRASRRSTSRPVLAKSYDAKKMVKMGEAFYTSLGMDPLPDDVLGALACSPSRAGKERRLPRERVGRRSTTTTSASRCAST